MKSENITRLTSLGVVASVLLSMVPSTGAQAQQLPPSPGPVTAPPQPARFQTATMSAETCVNARALLARTERIRDDLARQGLEIPSLATSVFTADGILRTAVTGVRSVATGERATLDDQRAFGSVSKSWTAQAIASLVDQGRLRYDTTLAELFPDLPMPAAFRTATVQQVLNMRAGLTNLHNGASWEPFIEQHFTEEEFESLYGMEQRAATLRFTEKLFADGPEFTPGSRIRYSNGSYIVAQAIVERITGRNVQDVIRDVVFTPARASVGLASDLFGRPGVIHPHVEGDDGLIALPRDGEENFVFYGLTPMTGSGTTLTATIGDYARVEQAQLRALLGDRSGTALSAASIRHVYTPDGVEPWVENFRNGDPLRYHSGFMHVGALKWRNGGTQGESSASVLNTGNGIGSAYFFNSDGEVPDEIGTLLSLQELAGLGIGKAGSADEAAIYASLERLCGQGPAPLVALIGETPVAGTARLAEAMAPDDARLAPAMLVGAGDHFLDQVGRAASAGSGGPGLRAEAIGGLQRGDTMLDSVGRARITTKLAGFIAEFGLDEDWYMGAGYGYMEAQSRAKGRDAGARADLHQAAAWVGYGTGDGFYARVLAGGAFGKTHTDRLVRADRLDLGRPRAERDSRTLMAEATVGYAVTLENGTEVSPFASVRYLQTRLDKATERGSIAALTLDTDTRDLARVKAGLRTRAEMDLGGGWTMYPEASVALVREFDRPDGPVLARLAGDTGLSRFTAPLEDSTFGEAGFGITLSTGTLLLTAGGESRFEREGGNRTTWSLRIGMRF